MSTKKGLYIGCLLLIFITVTGLSLIMAPKAGASFFPDVVDAVKNLISPKAPAALSVDSDIKLVEDENKNGQIDAGDIVRFTFNIINPTNQSIRFATLKTNIDKNSINFVHNVVGTTGLDDSGGVITLPNLRVDAGQQKTISFEARIDYYQNEDKTISTEPELVDSNKKSLLKSAKKQIKAMRIKPENMPKQFSEIKR